MQSAPSTSYPNVGPPPPPLMTSTMSVGVPMDLNNDGRADAIGYDTTGDGKVDCITLTLPNPNNSNYPNNPNKPIIYNPNTPRINLITLITASIRCNAHHTTR